MTARPAKAVRCAIYTRKSTEHGLELEFNSLDAQREACEAYVKSQAHEGWTSLATRYDDPAYSGGNLDRPALQNLLKEIDRGWVDVIVVYKIDRLTRSLADFAKLVEIFDAKSVSFVAITQQFNTTTSMGRLTLNVLLSFAQFERELSSERVRDKIAASRRKGKWTGGSVPLGYLAKDKKLVVDADDAEKVRYIFQRYYELGTIRLLQDDLKLKNIYSKQRPGPNGRSSGGMPLTYGPLAHLLRNRIYLGEIGHGDNWYPAEHEAIIDRQLFEKVQERLDTNRTIRTRKRSANAALLTGRLYDDRGNRMSPSHTVKNGVRYHFYVSTALIRGRKEQAGTIGRVSAPELEEAVVKAIRFHLPHLPADIPAKSLIQTNVERIEVSKPRLTIQLVGTPNMGGEPEDQPPEPIIVSWSPASVRPLVELDTRAAAHGPVPNTVLIQAIARAHAWLTQLSNRTHETIEILAEANDIHPKVVRKTIRLAFLSPQIVSMIFRGEQPRSMTLEILHDVAQPSWTDQELRSDNVIDSFRDVRFPTKSYAIADNPG